MQQVNYEDYTLPNMAKAGIYRGVVEDNKDPDKMGRVKVRIFGLHTQEKNSKTTEGIPTDDLPWAVPAGSTYGGTSKVGQFGVPLQGAHVYIFFEYNNPMKPVYFATAPGVPSSKPSSNKGFNDPDGEYPNTENMFESDWAEGESNTAEYPNNFVLARTKSGHTIEMDDTEGSERLIIKNGKTKAYIEFTKDGTIDIVPADGASNKEFIRGSKSTFVDENLDLNCGEKYRTITKTHESIVKGESVQKVRGSKHEDIGASITQTCGEKDVNSKGHWNVVAGGEGNIESGKNLKMRSKENDVEILAPFMGKGVSMKGKKEVKIEGKMEQVEIKSDRKVMITGQNEKVEISSNSQFIAKGNQTAKIEGNQTSVTGNSQVRIFGGMILIG